jgi:hypothetical protein
MIMRIYTPIFLITLLLILPMQLFAQAYVKVNYDTKTVAAMAGEYAAAAVAEGYYDEQVKDILAKYGVAEAAAAGIFASKHLDRKALTDLGIWSSRTENHYYQRIYHLVASKIIPMIWDTSGKLLHYPHKSLYWGSYLTKICGETQSLCMQFESAVTNSTLSFSDINFLELDPRFAAFMQLSQFEGMDWETLLDDFSSVSGNFTKENLEEDIGTLYDLGKQIGTSGFNNLTSDILGDSEFNGAFTEKALAVGSMAKNAYDIYRNADGKVENLFKQYIGNNPTAADIFSFSSYNLSGWIDDYLNEAKGTYYTQRWYIGRNEYGSEQIAAYHPPTDDNSVIKGAQWVRFSTSEPAFWPDNSQLEQVLSNSECYAGWSRSMIEQLNARNDGYTYHLSRSLQAYVISKGGKQTQKAYAYSITVTRSWSLKEEVHEEYFDSFTMDLPTFKLKMQALLNEYNDNEQGYTYQLKSDAKNYYQAADDAKLKGCEHVIISMTCTDNVTLGEGSTQYKCRDCGGSLNSHSKDCAMRTTLTGSEELDLSELDRQEAENLRQIMQLKIDIKALEADKKNDHTTQLARLRSQLSQLESKLFELQQAKAEAAKDNDIPTDVYYRIPAIMNDCRTAYGLSWQGEGWWSGYTYYRYATAPNINGTLTFQASLSIARKPQYFLGVKIHRAILKIDWKLSATYSDTQVVENISLNPEMSDAEKKALVNGKLAGLALAYPACKLSTEYIKSDLFEEDATNDTYHLLWASDRLAIARQVEVRLMHIYADLVSLNKMMNYKMSWLDVFKNILPDINEEQGRKQTIAERCRKRWLRYAADGYHSIHYNGKYEEPDTNE